MGEGGCDLYFPIQMYKIIMLFAFYNWCHFLLTPISAYRVQCRVWKISSCQIIPQSSHFSNFVFAFSISFEYIVRILKLKHLTRAVSPIAKGTPFFIPVFFFHVAPGCREIYILSGRKSLTYVHENVIVLVLYLGDQTYSQDCIMRTNICRV